MHICSLVPDRCTDEVVGLEHFNRVFHARYGSTGPILYMGSLEHALQDSVSASRDEVRFLILILHTSSPRQSCRDVH